MDPQTKNFFVSYNKEDKQWAKWIAAVLEAEGYSCFLQAWDFRPGDNLVLDMQKALTQSERFIAVLSQDYLDSLYCQAEWASAFTRDPNGEKRAFIPVRVTDVNPDGLFAAIIYIDLFGDDEKAAEKRLVQGVDTNDIPRNRPLFPGTKKVRFPGTMPLHNLPFSHNEYYEESGGLLGKISEGFKSGGTVALTQAIAGTGGLGKTQTALEYCYSHKPEYDYIWWVSAEDNMSVDKSYREIALKLQLINESQQNSEVIIETVLNWLDQHDKWLCVYDNLDKFDPKSSWWPKSRRGNILVTTRNQQIEMMKKLTIDIFTEDEAIRFLIKRSGVDDRGGAKELAERLGFFQLALEYAAAYIKKHNKTYCHYIGLLKDHMLETLDRSKSELYYERTVRATLELSIEKIEREAAKRLLYICSYFAPDNIAPWFFAKNAELLEPILEADLTNELDANEIWSDLTHYSLLKLQTDGKGYFMHRLLQDVVRTNIGDDTTWAVTCLELFTKNYDFEYGNIESHENFKQLSPHVKSCLDIAVNVLTDDENQTRIAYLYSNGGFGYNDLANYAEALEWHQKDLAISEKVLGKEHPDTATTYNNIGVVYMNQGGYPKALEWHQKALAIREKVLGKEHPDTAITYNNIAGVYKNQGNYPKALEWYQKALATREKVLGKEHPDTATTYNNVASVYNSQGDYPKALEWYQKDLAISEKVLGKEHPDTATTYNNIAGVYDSQGDYPKALEWYQKDLAINEKVLGKEHPDTATTYNNIAGVYNSQGDYPKALELYQKALVIREKVLGKEHPSTAITYNNIAGIYVDQGDYPKALEEFQKALAIRERVLGKEHPDTAATYNNIARVYYSQGDYPKALEWYQKALSIVEKVLGKEHPNTATTYNNIACVYYSQGDYPKALEEFQKALAIREKVLGTEHPDTANTYAGLTIVYHESGDVERAYEYLQKSEESKRLHELKNKK